MVGGKLVFSNGLRFAAPLVLMSLKARAYLNLIADREAGKQVNTKDIMKHRNDALKLAATMTGSDQATVAPEIAYTIREFSAISLATLPNQIITGCPSPIRCSIENVS